MTENDTLQLLFDAIDNGRVLMDGGVGSMKDRKWNGRRIEADFLIDNEWLQRIHGYYINAGARIITTDTLIFVPEIGDENDKEFMLADVPGRAEMARKAADSWMARNPGEQVWVAGGIGPGGGMGVTHKQLVYAFKLLAKRLAEQVDFILFETMTTAESVSAAVEAAEQLGVPFAVSLCPRSPEKMCDHVPLADVVAFCDKAFAVGVNCGIGDIDNVLDTLKAVVSLTDKPVMFYPSLGRARFLRYQPHWPVTLPKYLEVMREALSMPQVRMVGGCCGTTPRHIKALSEVMAQI